jgi:hypothetical protein
LSLPLLLFVFVFVGCLTFPVSGGWVWELVWLAQDCHIDVCSPEVLGLFEKEYDYGDLRKDFIKGVLVT